MNADAKDGMYKQQTAVEWLQELYNNRPAYEEFILEDEWEQAKAMEKEQIMNAAKTVLFNSTGSGDTAAEQYYNETYKK